MKLQITLKKSPIASKPNHKKNVEALGLRKIGQTVVMEDIPSVRGKIFAIKHMVQVEEIQ